MEGDVTETRVSRRRPARQWLRSAALSLAAAAMLAAPAHAWRISNETISPSYDPFELNYAGADGRAVWTVVIGNPFAAPKPVVDDVITESMHGAHFGQHVTFSTQREPDTRDAYRIVFLLNGNTATGARICEYYPNRPLGPGDHGTKVHVVATYCRGEQALTQVVGTSEAGDPTAPDFQQLIRQMTTNLFPPRNDDQFRRGGKWPN